MNLLHLLAQSEYSRTCVVGNRKLSFFFFFRAYLQRNGRKETNKKSRSMATPAWLTDRLVQASISLHFENFSTLNQLLVQHSSRPSHSCSLLSFQ